MNLLRGAALAMIVAGPVVVTEGRAAPPVSSGYVDASMFRALVDESQEIVEVNLEGAVLEALAKQKGEDPEDEQTSDLFGKLKAIHAVIGTVKGPASAAAALVRQTDQKLYDAGWQRVTRIKSETALISVLTHTAGGRIDGLVTLIFDSEDKELVFANLAGEIDITRLGEIGDRLKVPGLDQVPGAR
ncbi:MAG TPA: DUF4252 domain-containing protein [Candidatus Polarisedimenticolaceae bacterium]|nr:DUF4252 domain-containing protein [Candidatus Polarisedimenticolaceae bacterium]